MRRYVTVRLAAAAAGIAIAGVAALTANGARVPCGVDGASFIPAVAAPG